MADTEVQGSEIAVSNFKVPKRNLNIGGIDKKNRPFNNRYNRPIKRNEVFEKLVSDGIISAVTLGAKNCFFIKELSEENKEKLLAKIDAENKISQLKYTGVDLEDKGWWSVYTSSKDGIKPCKEISEVINEYHSFDDPEDKNCLTMYGEIGFSVDFSKLNMKCNEEGEIVFPYGTLFFSDSKSFVNQFSATCAVLPMRLERARNNAYIKPINSENWFDARIKGSFRSSGHFVIFYVSDVETVTEEDGSVKEYPKVSLIDIEVLLNRDKDGTISTIGIGKVDQTCVVSKEMPGDPYGSEISYLIKNVFGKHSVASIASSRFVSDYIYLVGDDPRYYDLSLFRTDDMKERKKNEKFGTSENKTTVSEEAPVSKAKPKKKAKKANRTDTESVTAADSESNTQSE